MNTVSSNIKQEVPLSQRVTHKKDKDLIQESESKNPQVSSEAFFQLGNKHFESRDFSLAAKYFKDALENLNNFPDEQQQMRNRVIELFNIISNNYPQTSWAKLIKDAYTEYLPDLFNV